MKWKKDWSSDKQEQQVPWASPVLHVVCETVCVLVSSAFTGQVWGLWIIVQALGVKKVLILFFQNSQILLSRTENGTYIFDYEVHVHEFVFYVFDFGSGDLIDHT
jgi:hypothetical protein